MDIVKTLKELYEEKKRLDAAIARLETRVGPRLAKSRRGRKSMGAAERQEVSRRMRRYWAARRAAKGALNGQAGSVASQSAVSA
ncbi:MAG TPA: hypothetical protein VMH80_22785 [Bryobacteraceae bacterium]|nr:hypothetical protein [Bryobacteraceae bacterium]